MRDFGRGAGRPEDNDSLDAIAHSDQMLDALAGQFRVQPTDRGEAELLALLEGWRDGVRRPPAGNVISEHDAAVAVQRGLAQRPTAPKGTRRHLAAVGSVAAAVLCIGGFGAVVAGAGPGDSLYGMRTALFGEPQEVRDDQVALAAQTEMAEVQRLIEQGDWDQAQQKLETVTTAVAGVEDTARKQELVNEWHELNVKVETRDAAATLPPPAPGEPELSLPPLVVDVTTSPSETLPAETSPSATSETSTPAENSTPTETTPGQTTPVETTPTPTPTSSVGAPEPTTTTVPTPSSSPSPTTPPPTTSRTPATTSNPPTITSTTAPPASTTTPPPSSSATRTTTTTTTTEARADAPTSAVPSSTLVDAETEIVPTVQPEVPTAQQVPTVLAPPTTTTVPGGPLIQLPPILGLN
jgi:hypothetical protein